MTGTAEVAKDFVPYMTKVMDGSIVFYVNPNHSIADNCVANSNLCYIRDGVVLAIVRFAMGVPIKNGTDRALVIDAVYYPDGVRHPEYFRGLSAIDVAVASHKGEFVGLTNASRDTLIWRIDDMRMSRKGHTYYIAVSEGDSEISFQAKPYVYDERSTVEILGYDQLVELATTTESSMTTWRVDRFLGDKAMPASAYYRLGGRLVIEELWRIVRDNDLACAS